MVTLPSPSDSPDEYAPSAPGRFNFGRRQPHHFFSAPASPIGSLSSVFGVPDENELEIPKLQGLQKHKKQQLKQKHLDEVLREEPHPLKLPPGLQNSNKSNGELSGSRNSVLRRSFSFLSIKRNQEVEVDPFLAALMHVRDHDDEEEQGMLNKRSQSFSSLRATTPQWSGYNSETGLLQQRKAPRLSRKLAPHAKQRSDSGRWVEFKDRLRPCSGALKRFLELWKSRIKLFHQFGTTGCLRSEKKQV